MKRFIALFLLSVFAVSPASFALGADVSISVGEGSEGVEINETNFPDKVFRDYISGKVYDKDENKILSNSEIAAVTSFSFRSRNISSLKGIEYFTALKELDCYGNKLTALDVSHNVALTRLDCSQNQLTALDVSSNTKLTSLNCSTNQLTVLDVSKNTELTSLLCYQNQLTGLNLSANTSLTRLDCFQNQLTALDVSSNTELTYLSCNYNKITRLDVSKNNKLELMFCRGNKLTELNVNGCTALMTLDFTSNDMAEFDASPCTNLQELSCENNKLTALTVANNNLTALNIANNQFTTLDVSNNAKLASLNCSNNQLTQLNVISNTALIGLYCSNNQITELDVSKNSALKYLYCDNTPLETLNVSSNTALTELSCSSNDISALNLSSNTALKYLNCSSNQLTALDVSNLTQLNSLFCGKNQLTALYVNSNTNLTRLDCSYNLLTALNLNSSTNLTALSCDNNQLKELDLTANANLSTLSCYYQTIDGLALTKTGDSSYPYQFSFSGYSNLANISAVQGKNTNDDDIDTTYENGTAKFASYPASVTYYYAVGYSDEKMDVTMFSEPEPEPEGVAVDGDNFPDENFRAYITENFDEDENGYLSDEEIAAVTSIDVHSKKISSLEGVKYFTALISLDCGYTNQLETLDVSNNTALRYLDCRSGKLTELDLSENKALEELYCSGNLLEKLDVSNNTALRWLNCYGNKLSTLDASNLTSLKTLYCSSNDMTSLNVSGCTSLETLYCDGNKLTALNLESNTALNMLYCHSNDLTAIDVSKNAALTALRCYNNKLSALDVSSNYALTWLYCNDNKITALDVSSNTALKTLQCSNNQLTALDVSKNTELTKLYCEGNNITELDIRKCPNLTRDNFTADSNVRITHGKHEGFPKFSLHSLVLRGQLGVDFYVNIPEGVKTDGAYMNFTVSEDTRTPLMFSNVSGDDVIGDDTYRFTCYINSIQMADSISAAFCYSGDSNCLTEEYTAKKYLDAIISSTDIQAKSPDLVALAGAIKDYGHYVQIPLSDFNGWKLGTDHAIMDYANSNIDSDSADVKTKLRKYKLDKNIENSGIEELFYDIELESETALHIYLRPGNDAGNVSAYITDSDNEFDGTKNMAVYDPQNNRYVITIGGISAHKLGKVYSVRITTGKGENFPVKISALSYADAVMQAENDGKNINDDLKRAVISLYKYYAATMKYRGEPLAE